MRFRQRMPMKPQATGLKYFILADSKGFIYDAFLYKGSETQEVKVETKQKQHRDEGQTVRIVEYFLKRLEQKNHFFFMDMYYGGMTVLDLLQRYKHRGVLACQGNRPSEIFNNCLCAGCLNIHVN